ncbi:unnamed protein product [Prorocentrum cordatum]|uniref:Uncharacterized protein n=1 Tax=Prorocentrum cordatum TaxID=2364126 RepID=A0ABN9SQV1_9DINO|nr:unnamed protein product [Polarella glacialis]
MTFSGVLAIMMLLGCARAAQLDMEELSNATGWIKICQIQDGSRGSYSFPLTTGAYGSIASSIGSSHAKYSDSDINSMAVARDGYSHVYQIKSLDCSSYLYVRSNDTYVDTSRSFGLTRSSTRVCLAPSYESCSTWATLPCTSHGIDLLYTSPGLGGESCCRYFFGHGQLDCWGGPSGYRCVNGGSDCSSYKKLEDVVFYVWGVSAATPSPTPNPTATDDDDHNHDGDGLLCSQPGGRCAIFFSHPSYF